MSGISNHYDALVAIKAIIDGLALTGLSGGVKIQEVAEYQDGQSVLPFVSVSPYGPEDLSSQTNFEDGVDYGVAVAIFAVPDVNSLETRLGWRQKMRRNLYNHNITTSVPGECYSMLIKPKNVVEPMLWNNRRGFCSAFIVMVQFQEPRT